MYNYRYNTFLIFRNVIATLQHAEWGSAYAKGGIGGTLIEVISSILGTNTWPFFIDSEGGWGRKAITLLLESHGIAMWGWGYSRGKFMFRVKKQQARWAEYVMLKHGVPVRGHLLHSHFSPNIAFATLTDLPQEDPTSPEETSAPSDTLLHPVERRNFLRNPIDEINNFADRLGNF